MGYDLLAAVFLVAITPFVIAGFVLFWMVNAKDHDDVARTRRAFARARGVEFVPPVGEWPNRTAPTLAWTEDEARRPRPCRSGRRASQSAFSPSG